MTGILSGMQQQQQAEVYLVLYVPTPKFISYVERLCFGSNVHNSRNLCHFFLWLFSVLLRGYKKLLIAFPPLLAPPYLILGRKFAGRQNDRILMIMKMENGDCCSTFFFTATQWLRQTYADRW